VGNEN